MRAATQRGRLWRAPGRAAAGLALALALAGCRHWGGDWARWAPPEAAAEPTSELGSELGPGPVEILILGHGSERRVSQAVVDVAAAELAAARAAGRPALALWLATDLGPPGPERSGACPSEPPLPPAAGELAAAAARVGASVWGLPGPDLWRCGQALPQRATVYQQPGLAYVIRVGADGRVELGSRCEGSSCALVPAPTPPRLELVVLDLSWWVFPDLGEPALAARAEAQQASLLAALAAAEPSLELVVLDLSWWVFPDLGEPVLAARAEAQQASLLAALAAAEPSPRILVSTIPVDSTGSRGLGGRRQRTGFRYLPEPVQQAIAAGLFIGSVGALERDLQISADLSHAIHRGDRSFVAVPLFGVVSGSAGGAGYTLPTSRASALLPDLWTEHPGLVSVRVGASTVELRAIARVGGRWREASVEVPLRPTPHTPLRPAPVIQPCPSCDPLSGAADGEVFVPRPPRPR